MAIKTTTYDSIILLKDTDLTVPEKMLYLYICDICSWKKARFTRKYDNIQEDLAMPKSTLKKYLKTLVDKGFIYKVVHHMNYGGSTPYKSAFIYPLKFHKELFEQKKIDQITDNTIAELQGIQDTTKNGTQKMIDTLLKIKEDNKVKEVA